MAVCLSEKSDARRAEFIELLARTRKGEVPLQVTPSKPRSKDDLASVLNSGDVFVFKTAVLPLPFGEDLFDEQTFTISTEAGDQGKLPVLIVKLRTREVQNGSSIKRPAVVLLHSSFRCKEYMRPLLEDYASRGYIAAAIDMRYHGERADSEGSYESALVSAWRTGQSMPFIFDTVWDVMKLMDYLVTREDVDPLRIAIMGLSLGGMVTIYAAAADPRFAVAVPVIGTQNFQWAVLNNRWHARVNSIPLVFREAAKDLGKNSVDGETVAKVWQRIAPGLIDKFDNEEMISLIAPRPLLILNGEDDPRCPIEGLEKVIHDTFIEYEKHGAHNHFQFVAEPKIAHSITPFMLNKARAWIDKFIQPLHQ